MTYIVEQVSEKTVNTKFGPKPAFSTKANGEWYSCGFKKPKFNIGDEIDFQFTENSYGKQMDDKSVRVISKGEGAPAPTASAAPSAAPARSTGYAAKVFPIPPLHGDRAIVRQNSITNATKALSGGNGADLLEVDTVEEYAQAIISLARMFEAYSCGDLDAEQAAKMVSAE